MKKFDMMRVVSQNEKCVTYFTIFSNHVVITELISLSMKLSTTNTKSSEFRGECVKDIVQCVKIVAEIWSLYTDTES